MEDFFVMQLVRFPTFVHRAPEMILNAPFPVEAF